jgi:hypothetical protein
MPVTDMLTRDPAQATPRVWGESGEIAPDVFMVPAFVNTYALRTDGGLLIVDPGFGHTSATVRDAVRAWSDAPLHTAVYTHGHVDHAFGLRAFLAAGERPQIVAQENCLARFRRYALTNGWNARINQRQFSLPQPFFPHHFDWPTLTFRDAGAAPGRPKCSARRQGETDDPAGLGAVARLPLHRRPDHLAGAELRQSAKVQRYPAGADALEAMAGRRRMALPGHGLAVQGRDAVRTPREAARLRIIIEQVLAHVRRADTRGDLSPVEPDLNWRRGLPATNYDHPKFIVRNLLRLWGGWWNGNAAELLPSTAAAQAVEIAALAGGVDKVIARGRALLDAGDSKLAAHCAEWATRAAPGDRTAQELKRDVYERRLAEESSLMAQGIYRAAMNDARTALAEEKESVNRLVMGWKE